MRKSEFLSSAQPNFLKMFRQTSLFSRQIFISACLQILSLKLIVLIVIFL